MSVWPCQFLQFAVFEHRLVQLINFLVFRGIVKGVYLAISTEFFRLATIAPVVSGDLKRSVERIMVIFVLEVADLILMVEIEQVERV